ncbi:MAG TPA: RagB/SusD family nutrient uptake outer membrane protein [Flavisolibacter sp.]|nr:RagB/SusD family nutrient uptake outer membrane protein [Flavisolibacter sp.]
MKTIKRIHIAVLLLMVTLVSCEKLDRELETDLTLQQVERSFPNVQNMLNGLYAELREGFQEIGGDAMMASTTDEAEHTNENSSVQAFNQGAWNAVTNPAEVWTQYFRAIRKANIFLQTAAPEKVNLDAFKTDQTTYGQRLAEVARWRYEARFLRAFYYFELIKRYGGIPLTTVPLSEADIPGAQRNTLQQSIQFVSDECDSAALNLPLTYPAGELGRATRGAALALKSRLLLYAASDLFNTPSWASGYANPELIALPAGDRAARWKAAADAAKAVIDLAGTGYALAPNYRTLFTTFTGTSAPEIIFTRRNGASNAFEVINFPIGYDRGNSGTTPTQDLVDAYEVKVSNTSAVPFDWNNPAHAATPYANRDPRLGLSVVTNASSFNGSGTNRPVETFTGGKDGQPIPNATKTGYYLRKYVAEGTNLTNNTGSAIHSWIYFRLAEIYLNYAEALNEYAPGNADIKINVDRVRTRTGVAMPPMPAGSQSEIRQRIRNERRVELAFEDHRAWDTRRWMTAPAILGASVRGVNITKTGATTFTYAPFVLEPRAFEAKMYLFPIPQTDLNIAKGLKQNPLW